MAKSTCACARFATTHYPISRKGPHYSSGPAILLVCTDEDRPPHGLQDNIQHMETFFRGLNLRINRIHIHTPVALEYALSVITNAKLDPAKNTGISDSIWDARILAEDSLCFIGVISNGSNAYTRLSNGANISDVNIEQFFNEEYCVLLRGKPKLFLYFKYYDSSIGRAGTVEMTPGTSTLHTGGINWRDPTTSTNMNFLSFYVYEFGLPALQTEYSSSTALYELQHAYQRNATDVVTFFREFFNKMIELQSQSKSNKRRLPCVCLFGRYRMRSRLYLLQPIHEYSHEEQDLENDISETLSNYSGLSLTPRATTPQAGFQTQPKYNLSTNHYSSQHTKPPASYRRNAQSASEITPVRSKGKIPLTSRHKKHYGHKRMDNSHIQQNFRKPYNHTSYQHKRHNPNSQEIPHEYYYNPQNRPIRTWKSWKKRMRVRRKRSRRFDNQYKRYADVATDSVRVNESTKM